jgi:hypothetical protein
MVVDDDPVVEIDRPFPLRTIDVDAVPVEDIEAELRPQKTFLSVARGWFNALIILGLLAAYPVLVVMSSDVGDKSFPDVDRADWTAPWAGGASMLMEKHFGELGWASDAPSWAPMARLTAKPAYQTAMAESVGEYINLMQRQTVGAGTQDADLSAAARLASVNSTGVQMRAARDALVSYDRRLRRRGAQPVSDLTQLASQLSLVESWATRSQGELTLTSETLGGSPMDENATIAVYKAKGRAMAAYTFIETMLWPEDSKAVTARNNALAAWKAAAEFHPLVVLNGSPDGSFFGNHAASMGFLINQAQKATADYRAALAIPAPAAPVVAEAAPAPAPAATTPARTTK